MNYNFNIYFIRWLVIATSFVIISLILWNTYVFFQSFKEEERQKVELLSEAQSEILEGLDNLDKEITGLTTKILETNTTTPMMIVDVKNDITDIKNIDTTAVEDVDDYLSTLKQRYKNENTPIEIKYNDMVFGYIYYGNSTVINKLKYYPLALLLIIILFGFVVYLFYKSSKNAAENIVWSGMAKETAHQIGTPLSSLIGWAELLKNEQLNPDYILEIEKDIDRLKIITERFSKIGSEPKLKAYDLVSETKKIVDYLTKRSSKHLTFHFDTPKEPLIVLLNATLFSWALENIIKNGIDAMKGKGTMTLKIISEKNWISLTICDTGVGLLKKDFNRIFKSGYTTKKSGWGLGLSLSKRIIEDFHKGVVKVVKSKPNEGTSIQIRLRKLPAKP